MVLTRRVPSASTNSPLESPSWPTGTARLNHPATVDTAASKAGGRACLAHRPSAPSLHSLTCEAPVDHSQSTDKGGVDPKRVKGLDPGKTSETSQRNEADEKSSRGEGVNRAALGWGTGDMIVRARAAGGGPGN